MAYQYSGQAFIEAVKNICARRGWKSGYTASLDDRKTQELRKEIKALSRKLSVSLNTVANAFPNKGTYTYVDGIVDFTLAAMNTQTQTYMDMMKLVNEVGGVLVFDFA